MKICAHCKREVKFGDEICPFCGNPTSKSQGQNEFEHSASSNSSKYGLDSYFPKSNKSSENNQDGAGTEHNDTVYVGSESIRQSRIICKSEISRTLKLVVEILSTLFLVLGIICMIAYIPDAGDVSISFLIVSICSLILGIAFLIIAIIVSKSEIIVYESCVLVKGAFGKKVVFPISHISTVGIGVFKHIYIVSPSCKAGAIFVMNNGVLLEHISNLLIKRQNDTKTSASAMEGAV